MRKYLVIGLLLWTVAGCSGGRPVPGGAPTAGSADRYLAIVDARGDAGGGAGRFHVIDTVERKLVNTTKRVAPDGLILPDGSALLVGGGKEGLTRIDPADWKPARSLETAAHGWWLMYPEMTQYALSPDGRRLHAVVYHPDAEGAEGPGRLAVQSVDLVDWKVLQPAIEVPPCAGRVLAPANDRVYHICNAGPLSVLDLKEGKEIRRVNVGPITYQGRVAYGSGGGRQARYAGEFLRQDGRVVILGTSGTLLEVDPDRGSVKELANLAFPGDHAIPHRQAALSPDGKLIYVGTAAGGNRCSPGCATDDLGAALEADTVRVYDTASWKELRSFQVRPFYSLAVTAGGSELLLVSLTERAVSFADSTTGNELAVIARVGSSPTLIMGPPAPRLP